MEIFSSLLSGPALTILAVVIALGLVVHALTALAKDIPDLRIRLDQTQSRLDTQLSGIHACKETIEEMREAITPQEKQAQKLQEYHNTLLYIEHKHALAEQEREASNEIQIHHRGSQ